MIRTKYFRIDTLGVLIWKYRITKSKIVEGLNKDGAYKVKSLPFGYKVYYL